MFSRRIKHGVFVLEALNSISTTLYFYYLYFFMQQQFGFGRMQNLLLAAGLGFVYVPAALFGGRFAQRRGYFLALRVGFFVMAVSLVVGSFLQGLLPHLLVAIVCTIGMCFTWPTLEAIVSEKETPAHLQKLIGIYNLVWAGFGAAAFFIGGAMLETFGLRSMFLVPAGIIGVQFAVAWILERQSLRTATPELIPSASHLIFNEPIPANLAVSPATFLKMAWLANPFAYLAINTVVAVIPSIAAKLGLSAAQAGFFCSVWFFVRTASFALLWKWNGWHYRFTWLLLSFAAVLVSFVFILLAPNLGALIGAQIAFGLALGLIYYSSLYYSMEVGETKGEHGGIHEAAIGVGNCAGPAVGATALYFFPQHVHSSTIAVSGFLLIGLLGLLWLRFKRI